MYFRSREGYNLFTGWFWSLRRPSLLTRHDTPFMSSDEESPVSAQPETVQKPSRGWNGSPTGKPAHTGKHLPEKQRLRMMITVRKKALKRLDKRYVESRERLLGELGDFEARVAQIERGESDDDSAAWS